MKMPLRNGLLLAGFLGLTGMAQAVVGLPYATNAVTAGGGVGGSYNYFIYVNPALGSFDSVYLPLLANPSTLIVGTPSMSVAGTWYTTNAVPIWEDFQGSYSFDYGDYNDDFTNPPYFLVFDFDEPTTESFTLSFDSPNAPINGPYQLNNTVSPESAMIDPPTPNPIPEPSAFVALLALGLTIAARRFRR